MKARCWKGNPYGADLSSKERKALDKEIRRQIIELDKQHSDDVDSMVLYTLHTRFGFGKKRLRQFYEALLQEHDKLVHHYDMPDDYPWLCKHKLKEIGVDIEQWNQELIIEEAK